MVQVHCTTTRNHKDMLNAVFDRIAGYIVRKFHDLFSLPAIPKRRFHNRLIQGHGFEEAKFRPNAVGLWHVSAKVPAVIYLT